MLQVYAERRWVFNIFCVIFINFNSVLVSLADQCETCGIGNCQPITFTFTTNCFCERTVVRSTEQRWDRWQGRYIEVQSDQVSHASAKCYHFNKDSILSGDTCAEDPCRSITFYTSEMPTVPINFFKLSPYVEVIYLNDSGVKTLQVGAFTGLAKLHTLQLESNQLAKIQSGCLNTLSTLRTLDLHSNALKTIDEEAFLGLSSLEYLDLSRNELRSITTNLLNPLTNLVNLVLSHNLLTVVDFNTDKLTSLNSLYLNHNNIEDIQECFEDTKISSLFLQNNAVSFLNDSCFPSTISVLNLANNNISRLDMLGDFGSLTTLNVSNNGITQIPIDSFKKLGNLMKLDLSRNRIEGWKTGVFSVAKNVEYLNLSRSNLQRTDPHVFIPLNNLKILDISYNNLDYWEGESFLHFDNFEKIFLEGNRFSCHIISSIIKQSRVRNFSLVFDPDYTVENINGLPCGNVEVPSTTENVKTTVGKNWEDLRIRMKHVEENLETSVVNFGVIMSRNIETSLKSATDSIKSEFLSFQQIMRQFMYTMRSNVSKNTQSMGIIHNPDPSLNASINNMEKKLTNSLSQLKIFMIVGFSSLACIFTIVKIVSSCVNSRRKFNSFELGQELPILSR